MRVSVLALGMATVLTAPPATADSPHPPASALGDLEPASEREDDEGQWRVGENGGKLGVRASTRRIYGIRTYGVEPTLLLGHRLASKRVGIYGSGAVFIGRTTAGLAELSHTVGVEVDVIHGRWFLDFGGTVGIVAVRRATVPRFLSDWVAGPYFGVGANLAESAHGEALTLEQRSAIEAYGRVDDLNAEQDPPLIDTIAFASSLFLGVSW